jgi:Predicted acetyltransferase involved in intracellular survival and related acetyltransferases
MKEEVKKLWNLCFGDDEAFTELYFSKRYSDEVNLAIEENGNIISALQILPYPMTFCGEIISTGYISGACTHPDYREKGAMKRLLLKSFTRMQDNEVPLTTLIPAEKWLFSYYSKMGYTPVFEYSNKTFTVEELKPSSEYIVSKYTSQPFLQEEVYSFFDEKMKNRPYCIQHSYDDFLVIMDDLKLGNGELLIARSKGKIKGLAFCYAKENRLHVPELFLENDSVRDTLLFTAAEQFQVKEISCIIPPNDEMGNILGMARIIDAEKLLNIYTIHHPKLEASFNINDEFIKKNNAFYSIKSGKLEIAEINKNFKSFSIQELTQGLLGYKTELLPKELQLFDRQKPYMSLMLN